MHVHYSRGPCSPHGLAGELGIGGCPAVPSGTTQATWRRHRRGSTSRPGSRCHNPNDCCQGRRSSSNPGSGSATIKLLPTSATRRLRALPPQPVTQAPDVGDLTCVLHVIADDTHQTYADGDRLFPLRLVKDAIEVSGRERG